MALSAAIALADLYQADDVAETAEARACARADGP